MNGLPKTRTARTPVELALIAAVCAYVMWGMYPVYFKSIEQVSAIEILAHRIVWSVPFGAMIITARKQWGDVGRAVRNAKTLGALAVASVFIAFNWGLYIWAVNHAQIFQASLGYYINPLIFVLIGVVFLGDRLHWFQMIAVLMAFIGVAVLAVYGGQFPWIALVLAMSFTIYAIVRKQVDIGAMPGLFIEVSVLFLPALAYLVWLFSQGKALFLSGDMGLDILLMLAGPITVIPLLLFSFAARRLTLSTIGFLQFIGPTGQFLCGLYYGEPLTHAHLVCFAFIWSAVFFYVLGAMRLAKTKHVTVGI